MELWLAPLEGITGYIFRQCLRDIFPGEYSAVTPFLSPAAEHKFTKREMNEILPEHNEGMNVVPQIICHNHDDAYWAIERLGSMGYREVNLNLGCPSGTVTAKKKGSGFLRYPELLDEFFNDIFDRLEKSDSASKPEFSVKTRIGYSDEDEFEGLMDIFNKYPIKSLIIHPRLREDFYKGVPRDHVFEYAVNHTKHKLCYNGNIFAPGDIGRLQTRFPSVDSYMIGRAGVASPWIFQDIMAVYSDGSAEKPDGSIVKLTADEKKKKLEEFHNRILEEYLAYMESDRNTLYKMKELWIYWGCHFPESPKLIKGIRKSQKLPEYKAIVRQLFSQEYFKDEAIPEYK